MKKNKGMTLIELVLVIGLAALFSIGLYAIYNKTSDSYRLTEEAKEMNSILASARTFIDSTRVTGIRYLTKGGESVSFDIISKDNYY